MRICFFDPYDYEETFEEFKPEYFLTLLNSLDCMTSFRQTKIQSVQVS